MGNEWNIHDYTYIMGKLDIHMFMENYHDWHTNRDDNRNSLFT